MASLDPTDRTASIKFREACIRCPMLRVDPKMLDRLGEIETDLHARRKRAEEEAWLGEIEGLDLTLSFLKTTREEALRLNRIPAVDIGMPTTHASSTKESP